MSQNVIYIIYLFNIFTLLVVGALLLFINTTPELHKLKYHKAKQCLAIAAIIVALGQVVMLHDGTMENPMGIFPISVLLVATFQACLFTFLVLILFHSSYVTARNILKHLLPTAVFIVAYSITVSIHKDIAVHTLWDYIEHIGNPALLLRTVFVVTYGVQIVIYILLFNRERKLYVERINNYFSDTSKLKLQWGTRLFYQATAIGITVLVFSVKPTQIGDILLTLFLPLFYGTFAVKYINFQYTLPTIMAAVERDETPQTGQSNGNTEAAAAGITEKELCFRLNKLLGQEPFYLNQGIVIVDIATKLEVNKRTLSSYINTTYGKNFNSWINTMRIEYAREVMESCPKYTLQEIAEQSGFADNAMFSKEFKRRTGESPSVYRQKTPNG